MSATQKLLRFGVFELNLDTEELRKSGAVVKLPPQSFRLLELLATSAGLIVSRDEIQKQLWYGDTFVDFEHGVNRCINQIRNVLGDHAERPIYIETLPRQGYRFVAPVVSKMIAAPRPTVVESQSGERSRSTALTAMAPNVAANHSSAAPQIAVAPEPQVEPAPELRSRPRRSRLVWAAMVAIVVAASIGGGLYWRTHRTRAITEKDTIVVAEFDNKTGDTIFDGALRQGLSAQLQQSPFLNLLSDERVANTLALTTRAKDSRLTEELAREVCQRTGSAATIEGSISTLGSLYVVGLKAVDCHNGDLLADEQVTANDKEHVLKALGSAATELRAKLGESLASVQKYDLPLESVTTPSLEALRAYTLGYQAINAKLDYNAATQLFQQAISLDPNFAMAYARLGETYADLGETSRAAENLGKAYELRDRVDEREKLYIDSHYEDTVTGDLEAARRAYEAWVQRYPRDEIPLDNLGNLYFNLGQHELALATFRKHQEIDPGNGLSSEAMITAYTLLNRLDEARAIAQQIQAREPDALGIHGSLYQIDFLQHDVAGMEREAAAVLGKSGFEDQLLYLQSDTAAYGGQFAKARELTRRAVESAGRADMKESAAAYEAAAAVREAIVGNAALAKRQAQAALALSRGRDVEGMGAVALTLAGDSPLAMRLASDLSRRFPHDTFMQFNYLPVIRAGAALCSGSSDQALQALAPAVPYELGVITGSADFALYPVYLRGEAYLAAHNGARAAVEFQKILDHPGIVANEPIGALAHLGMGRAFALSGDTAKSKAAYRDFLMLWKDADADIPIYTQTKVEYATLH